MVEKDWQKNQDYATLGLVMKYFVLSRSGAAFTRELPELRCGLTRMQCETTCPSLRWSWTLGQRTK